MIHICILLIRCNISSIISFGVLFIGYGFVGGLDLLFSFLSSALLFVSFEIGSFLTLFVYDIFKNNVISSTCVIICIYTIFILCVFNEFIIFVIILMYNYVL
eukprot:2154_1